jgi:VIT1/CCC1 family predicted Fe2+/Mn2+ transporter
MADIILGKNDIIAIIVGIALLLTGGLISTLYGGITQMVISQFQNATGSTLPNYVTPVLGYVPTILQMVGIALLVAVAVHVIKILMKAPESTTS